MISYKKDNILDQYRYQFLSFYLHTVQYIIKRIQYLIIKTISIVSRLFYVTLHKAN